MFEHFRFFFEGYLTLSTLEIGLLCSLLHSLFLPFLSQNRLNINFDPVHPRQVLRNGLRPERQVAGHTVDETVFDPSAHAMVQFLILAIQKLPAAATFCKNSHSRRKFCHSFSMLPFNMTFIIIIIIILDEHWNPSSRTHRELQRVYHRFAHF